MLSKLRSTHTGLLISAIFILYIPFSYCSKCDYTVYGKDDAPEYDFISTFNNFKRVIGVRIDRRSGTHVGQTSYEFRRRAERGDLIIPTRNLFSDGFPSEFSLSVTLKLASVTRRESWDLIDITNPQGETDFAVRFVGELRQIHLLYRDKVLNTLTTVEFDKKDTRNVFTKGWHKLQISVQKTEASLYIDCTRIQTVQMESSDVSNLGYMTVAKSMSSKHTTPKFYLQWLAMHCDPTKPSRDSCEELEDIDDDSQTYKDIMLADK